MSKSKVRVYVSKMVVSKSQAKLGPQCGIMHINSTCYSLSKYVFCGCGNEITEERKRGKEEGRTALIYNSMYIFFQKPS